jgi:predicted cytidylate kinase
MGNRRVVVINGDLGSGKTSVSVLLAARLGVRRVSVGDLYRSMDAERGMTALQLNLHAELDEKIDRYVDELQAEIAASGAEMVVDSRLAWHFFPTALKVHLVTDPLVAARRVLGRPADAVEGYRSVEEARDRLASRGASERTRFLARYGVDKSQLRNYDIVCDSTRATPEEIVDRILRHEGGDRPACHLDPRRVVSTADATGDGPLGVEYAAPMFLAVTGRETLDAAVRSGQTLVPARLAAGAVLTAAHLTTR